MNELKPKIFNKIEWIKIPDIGIAIFFKSDISGSYEQFNKNFDKYFI